ncbi:hypothetical protein OAF42_03470 [Planctomicrobium sp.]|nr:hypothetical protein [Planctomicrobium sp.]MDB4733483.1 hypothetical protein [Planctomicrobium sp.]
MQKEIRFIWLLLMLAIVTTSLPAQSARNQRGGSGSAGNSQAIRYTAATVDRITLIRFEKVQDELKLETAQVQALGKVTTDNNSLVRKMTREAMSIRNLEQELRIPAFVEFKNKLKQTNKEAGVSVSKILTEDQNYRLQEILWQLQGINAFLNDQFAKLVEVSPEQLERIEETIEDIAAIQKGAGRSAQNLESMHRVRAKKALDEILTDAQTAKVLELQGESFSLSQASYQDQRRGERGGSR